MYRKHSNIILNSLDEVNESGITHSSRKTFVQKAERRGRYKQLCVVLSIIPGYKDNDIKKDKKPKFASLGKPKRGNFPLMWTPQVGEESKGL